MTPAISIDNLSLRLSGQPILDDVSLQMNPGEFLSIIGPNGAGKTSLIKCLCGIHKPHAGSIHIMGHDATRISSRKRAQLLSYVPQAEGQVFPFTVEEFVLMGRYTHLSPFTTISPDDRQHLERALDQTGTAPFRHRKLSTLSGGERQMVFIAAALAQEAEILVLDEPAAFLDYRHQADVFQLLRHLNHEHGHSIITVSHNVNTAARSSSRILALKNARRAFFGTSAELLDPHVLSDLFETPFRLIREPGHPLPWVATEVET